MENFLFECRRVYAVARDLNLSITGYSMSHVQRVMRICRQSSEHMALVGHPGSGRTQCVRLATFALNGQTLSIYPDASSHTTFEQSWRSAIGRAVQLATSTNHPINVLMRLDFCQDQVKPEWLDMLKQWLQQPIAGEMVTDETIISTGERIIEHEKMLATAMQTSNIRLPGQRSCRFLVSDTLRSSAVLEKILSARVSDFVHLFFLIGPRTIRHLQWCTIDCYLLLGNKEKSEMCMRVLAESELSLPQRLHTFKVLDRLYTIFMDNDAEAPTASRRMAPPESRVHFLLCKTFVKAYLQEKSSIAKRTNILKCALGTIAKIRDMSCADEDNVGSELMRQLDNSEMNLLALKREYSFKVSALERMKRDLQTKDRDLKEIRWKCDELQQKINTVVSKSRSEYDTASEKLRSYTAADYRKLASIKKPMIGVRFTIEAVRCLVDPTFHPQRNSLDTWTTSQELLRSLFLQNVLTSFDVDLVDATATQRLKRYLESREFKAAKVEVESNLAASLCQWITCVANLVAANAVVRKEYEELKQVIMGMQSLEEDVAALNDSVVGKNGEITRVGEEISRCEQQVVTNRRTLDHIQRSAQVLHVTATNQAKWQEELDASSRAFEYVLGDSIFMAAFSALLCDRSTRIRMVVVPIWKEELTRERIVFTEAICKPAFLVTRLLKNVDATERWPLLFENTGSIVDIVRRLHPASVSVDVQANSWQSEELIQQTERAVRMGTTLILHSIRSSPPVEWYPLISMDVEREFEVVHFYERSFPISPNAKLFFVTNASRTTFTAQFIHMTSTFVVDELLDSQQLHQAVVQLTDHQRIEDRHLLNLLGEHTASEILDSQDIVEQIVAAARDHVTEVVISKRMSLTQAVGVVFDRISTSMAAVVSFQVIEHLSEPAAVYVLWPIVVMIVIVQFLRPDSKEVEQPRSILITEKVEIVEEERLITVDTGVGTEPMSIDILRSIAKAQCAIRSGRSSKRTKSRDSMVAKERFFEEQTTFVDAAEEDKDDLDETLLDPTMASFVCKSDKSLLALPKVGIQIVRFEKEDFNDGIGLITAVKGDSLIVKKVVKGSAACGRVCSGDRISAINGNSISIGQKSGELLHSLLKEAVNKREPFEVTIVIGSRLEDLGISRMSCSFLPCSQEKQ